MEAQINRIGDVTIERVTAESQKNASEMTFSSDSDSETQISDDELNAEQSESLDLDPPKRKNDFDDLTVSKKSKIESKFSENEDSEYDSEEDSDLEDPGSKPGTPKAVIEAENTDFIEKLTNELGESSQKDEAKIDTSEYEYDITEKLKEMGEISVETVKKGEKIRKTDTDDLENEISVTPAKKDSGSDSDDKLSSEKKIGNLRRNIREVMDETQLDEATLAAQRQEMERLRRVQEQQRIIREVQRQIALNRQNNKTQHRVISLLQGNSLIKNLPSSSKDPSASSSGGPSAPPQKLGNTFLVKLPNGEMKNMTRINKSSTPFDVIKLQKGAMQGKVPRNLIPIKKSSTGNLTPSVSIAPVSKKLEPKIESDSDSELSDSDKKVRKMADVVTISSSSDDDCIVLSEEDEEPEPEEDPCNSGMHTNDSYNVPDEQGRVLINVGHPENESDIFLAPQIARVIKPHQIGGVRFLYDNVIESTDRFSTSTGFGCILAHSMGLGKTLQIVCFSDIFLRHTVSKTILCIMPINTLQNWMAEYNMWLPKEPANSPLLSHGEVRPRNFNLYVLNDSHKTLAARAKVIQEWHREGGVLLIGYELYRLLSLRRNPKSKKKKGSKTETPEPEDEDKNKSLFEEIHEALVKPGPDLVICDEGHRIKNSHASISQALKQIRSKRRIVLTGYPLQNNLLEYWCMVDFVRPNYLGTKTEFSNMFERPIQNGQCIDSTPQDIRLMRYRAHVLHSLLEGFVQRRSHAVLQTSLPQKEEYVLLVRMTEFQRKLYDTFMNEVVRTKTVPNPLKAFAVCCKIWNHPDVLYYFLKKQTAGDAVDIDLEEVAGGATLPKPDTPKKGSSRSKAPKKEKKAATSKTQNKEKPAASVTPNTTTNTNTTINTTTNAPTPEIAPPTAAHSFPTPAPSTPQPAPNPQGPQNYQNYPQNYQNYPQNYQYPQNSEYYQNQNYQNNYSGNYNQNWNQGGEFTNFYPENKEGYMNNYNNDQNYWQNNQQNNYYPPNNPQGDYYQNYPQNYPNYQQNYPQNYQYGPNNPYPQTQNWSGPQNEFKPDQNASNIDQKPELDQKEDPEMKKEEEKKEKEEEEEKEVDIKAAEIAAANLSKKEDPGIPYDWAHELMKGYVSGCIENSAKMQIFFCILEESMALGDRILLFSQSLFTLNLIEEFLQKSDVPGSTDKWAKSKNYYRLDGSTSALEREKLINEYNSNPNIHLFLVSTRAGSLGINLVGANRVIVFDASWNPCHDTQAVCRVYRYGQKKPCFVYRIVMDNCLEKKIYDRQINKQGMADRVVDECNPDAHLSMKDVTNLCWDDEKDSEVKDFSTNKDKYIDVVMQKVLDAFSHRLSKEPFQHESLLIDRKEKKLSQAEKRLAKRSYELEKQANINSRPTYNYYNSGSGQGLQIRAIRSADGSILQNKPVASVRPMQNESLVRDLSRPGGAPAGRSRWIPAEVWQRQGMTAQEMTLPLDVVIPTNSPDRGSIVLKAGQKVLVLKSPKGIYMQLECGKIVAIKTAFKVRGGKAPDKNDEGPKDGPPPTTILKKLPQGPSKSGAVPLPLKNNSAITVIPKGQQRLVKPFTQGVTKLNMKSIRQPVPNLIGRQMPVRVGGPRFTGKIQSIHRKVQLAKAKPYNMDKPVEPVKIKTEPQPVEPEPHVVPSSDEDGPEMVERDANVPVSGLEENEKADENEQNFNPTSNYVERYPQSFESFNKDPKFSVSTPTPISTPIIQETTSNRSLKNYRHNFASQKASKVIKTTSTALHQLEQTTSSIGENKLPFQESLDNITNSYVEKDQNLEENADESSEKSSNSSKVEQIPNSSAPLTSPAGALPPTPIPPSSVPLPVPPSPISGAPIPISGPPQNNSSTNAPPSQGGTPQDFGGSYSGYYGYGGPPYPQPPQNYYPVAETGPKTSENTSTNSTQPITQPPSAEVSPVAPPTPTSVQPPVQPPVPPVQPPVPPGPQTAQTPAQPSQTSLPPTTGAGSTAPTGPNPAQGPPGYGAPPGGFAPYGPPPPHAGYDVYGQQNQYGNYPGLPYPNQPNYQPYQQYDQSYTGPNMYSAFHRPEVPQYGPVGTDPYQYRNYPPQYNYGPPGGSAPQYAAPGAPGYDYQYPPAPFVGPYVPNNNPTP